MHVPKPILFGLTLIGAVLLGWALRVTTASVGAEAATAATAAPGPVAPVYVTVVPADRNPGDPPDSGTPTGQPGLEDRELPQMVPASSLTASDSEPVMYTMNGGADGATPITRGPTPAPAYVPRDLPQNVTNSGTPSLTGPATMQIVANGNHIVIAQNGAIVSVGDNTTLKANTGDASASGTIGLDIQGSTLTSGNSQQSTTVPAPVAPVGTQPRPVPVLRIPGDWSSLPRRSIGASAPTAVASPRPGATAPWRPVRTGPTPPRTRAVGIAGYEVHSIDVGGNDNLVTYDDSNLFFKRIGNLNGNTGDTDTSGLNVVDAQRSVVRSGGSGNSDETPDPPPFDPTKTRYAVGMPASAGSNGSGAAQVADINGVSTACADDTLVIGGDGVDDQGVRIHGNRNIATYDDGNVAYGGVGNVNAQIGDSDTSGTVAMAIRDSHIEAGGSFLPAWQQAGAQVGDPFDGNDVDVSPPGSPLTVQRTT